MPHPLERFSPATREWFEGAFTAPTTAQAGAWDAISSGQHALVVDRSGDHSQMLRGMFSVSQISKLLGASVETIEVARTFAEIGAELAR